MSNYQLWVLLMPHAASTSVALRPHALEPENCNDGFPELRDRERLSRCGRSETTTRIRMVLADKAIARGATVVFVRKLIIGVGLLSFAAFLLLVREAPAATSALVLVCAATGAPGICWLGFGSRQRITE